MIRLIIMLLLFFAIAVIASLLADHSGMIHIELGGYQIAGSTGVALGFALFLFAAGGFLVWLVGWVRRGLPFVGSDAAIRRQSQGLKLLNRSLIALAAGDSRLARRLVLEAEVLLPPQPMTHLLAAETALKLGDEKEATIRFKKLKELKEGRFLGLRGLMITARRAGQEGEALRLCREAFKENPNSPWLIENLFALEISAGHWQRASKLLTDIRKQKLLSDSEIKSHQAALNYGQAMESTLKGDSAQARKLLIASLKARPNFGPASAALARLDSAEGRIKDAAKKLQEAWSAHPYPSLLSGYKALDPAETRIAWLGRVQDLVKAQKNHPLSLVAVGQAALDAGATDICHSVVKDLSKLEDTRPGIKLALDLAKQNGEPTTEFEERLAVAPDGPGWICSNCAHRPGDWGPLCPGCGGFDRLHWSPDSLTGNIDTAKSGVDPMITLIGDGFADNRPYNL